MTVSKVSGVARGVGIALHGGVTGSAGTAGIDAIIRTFINLDSVLVSHYLLATPITYPANFSVRIKFSTTTAARQHLIGGTIDNVQINGAGSLEYSIGGSTRVVALTTPFNGKLHELLIERVGGNETLDYDGVQISTSAINTNTAGGYTHVGTSTVLGNTFNGNLADVMFDNGVSTTFSLDQATGNIEYSDENTFGSTLWTNPPTNINAGWTDNLDDTYTHTGASSEMQIDSGSPLSPSTAYSVCIKVEGAGSAVIQLGGATVDGDNKTLGLFSGFHELVLTTNSTITFNAIRIISGTDCTVSLISVREILGNAVTYVNIPESNREDFQLGTGQWDNISPPTQVLPAVLEIA